MFNRFIGHLNEALGQACDAKKVGRWTVYGVYLSWRGTNFQPVDYVEPHHDQDKPIEVKTDPVLYGPVSLVKPFTFWSRKAAANRFAGAPLMETIQSLSNKVRVKNTVPGVTLTRSVLMGHSFGAYIIEKTLLQSMASEEGPYGSKSITPPADLVVLLNSAAPAIYAKEFIDFMKWHQIEKESTQATAFLPVTTATDPYWKRPFIVSITSESDLATKDVFPVGTLPEGLFDVGSYEGKESIAYNGANQKKFFTHTPGHCDFIVSHDLVPAAEIPKKVPFTSQGDDWILQYNLYAFHKDLHPDDLDVSKEYPMKQNEVILWGNKGYAKAGKKADDPDKRNEPAADPQLWKLQLSRYDEGHCGYNNTPYWIIRVPKQVISDHGDVWNPNTASLIAGLYRMAGLLVADSDSSKP